MKNKKLIDLYKEWMETGELPKGGLCIALLDTKYEEIIDEELSPTYEDRQTLKKEGLCTTYWASGLPEDHKDEMYGFTPLRQTIVLLICAIHNEL